MVLELLFVGLGFGKCFIKDRSRVVFVLFIFSFILAIRMKMGFFVLEGVALLLVRR